MTVRLLLAIDLPDDDKDVLAFGASQMAESAVEYLSGWYLVPNVNYSVESTEGGPDRPERCWQCGGPFHGATVCSWAEGDL